MDLTYAAVLDSYLADAPANNGGPTETIALLNSPSPATTLPNPALDAVPASFNLPVAVDGFRGVLAVRSARRRARGGAQLQSAPTCCRRRRPR